MNLRDVARRYAPRRARETVGKLRRLAMGPPVFATELGAYRLLPDPSPVPRLTLVLTSLSRRVAFGGVATVLDAFRRIGAQLAENGPIELRIATTEPDDLPVDNLMHGADRIELLSRCTKNTSMPTRANEIFIAYNWYAAANLGPLLSAQAEKFGVAPRPLFYFVQEYEPSFYPFSADHLLARWALEPGWPIHAIINSTLLAEYLLMQGHRFAKTYVFEPCLSAEMRPFLAERSAERRRRILVYSRPAIDRNCFPIVDRGLRLWAATYPEQTNWEVYSAGATHRAIPLGNGRRAVAVGKLSLAEYARLLCDSALGISLMASPHPSYPPLEMAHFGMRVITNRYANKDLSIYHDNIVSLADPRPETLATTLAEVCLEFEANPTAGPRGASRMPHYTNNDPFPLAAEIAADMTTILRA